MPKPFPFRTTLIAGLLVGACSHSTTGPGPEFLTDTYVLRTVSGTELPSNVYVNFGPSYLADTLDFDPPLLALWALPTLERRTATVLPLGRVNLATEYLSFEREGDILTFRLPCPPEADCIIGFLEGTLSGDWLEITLPAPYRSPLRYERLQ